jgi:thymidine kinase
MKFLKKIIFSSIPFFPGLVGMNKITKGLNFFKQKQIDIADAQKLINPQFTLYVGSMFTGKTTSLITEIKSSKILNKKEVCVFKPIIDNRYSINSISTHNKEEYPAETFSNISELKSLINKKKSPLIIIDEINLIPSEDTLILYDLCWQLLKKNIKIRAAGLQRDCFTRPFLTTSILSGLANPIINLDNPLNRTEIQRFTIDKTGTKISSNSLEPIIKVGGNDSYEVVPLEKHEITNTDHKWDVWKKELKKIK